MDERKLLLTLMLLWHGAFANNLLDEIKSKPNFSQFASLIEKSRLVPVLLETRGITAFVPNNDAMDRFKGPKNEKLVMYHLANVPYKIQDVPEEVTTQLSGNPRLYVTRIPSGKPSITGWEGHEYFINNAKVISANHRAETDGGIPQFLHTVDQVIAPTVAQVVSGRHSYMYPDAKSVLEHSNIYGLKDKEGLKEYKERVEELNLMDTFAMEGKNTFFMPTSRALNQRRTDKNLIDQPVIHGHVVPGEVLFTRTVRDSKRQYKSQAFVDNVKAFISIENITNPDTKEMVYYVKSNTVSIAPSQRKGVALARIIRANIAVRNGVIHLIDRPLMVMSSSIMSYLQDDEGQLSQFNHLIRDHFPDMLNQLISDKDMTLFAPSNKAFEMVHEERLQRTIANKEELKNILRLHVITRRLATDEIVDRSSKGIFQEATRNPMQKLLFAVNKDTNPENPIPVVSLEGGGVNATITTPNIAAKNGIIHIIDRILGIPSQTVYEKLASDPMLSSTFELSEQKDWNEQLNDRARKFTIFAPSNEAWKYIHREMPSGYKKLFMKEFPYHVRYILDRHLIIDEELDIEELALLTTNSTLLRDNTRQAQMQMTRGKIYFQARVKEHFGDMETQP